MRIFLNTSFSFLDGSDNRLRCNQLILGKSKLRVNRSQVTRGPRTAFLRMGSMVPRSRGSQNSSQEPRIIDWKNDGLAFTSLTGVLSCASGSLDPPLPIRIIRGRQGYSILSGSIGVF